MNETLTGGVAAVQASHRFGRHAWLSTPGSWPRSLAIALLCLVGVRLFLTVEMALLAFQIPV
ncbi:MAG TPA: hypothetical protein VHS06_01530, partial [Chloroflexota bacterium]|nr:hypothetical protein [Chloroflexota bacterium]